MISFNFHKFNFNIFIALAVSLIFRLFLANFGTLDLDHGTFIAWSNSLQNDGLSDFYNGWSDYLPGYLYVLWFLAKLNIFVDFQTILYKLPAIISDLLTGYLIYKIAKNQFLKTNNQSILYFLAYVFNPAVLSNSTLWGQVDSLTSLFAILSIYVFKKNILLSAIFLALGTLVKPQAAFILPVFLYLFLIDKKKIIDYFVFTLTGVFVFVLGFIPFNNIDANIYLFITERLSLSAQQYPYGSVNAFSFWGLFGFWKNEGYGMLMGVLLSLILSFASIFYFVKHKIANKEYQLATFMFFVTFMFLTRMHERHLLPVFAPLLISTMQNKSLFYPYFVLSLTYLANMYYAFVWITDNFKSIFNQVMVNVFILLNLLSLSLVFANFFRQIKLKIVDYKYLLKKQPARYLKYNFKLEDIQDKKATIIIFTLVFLSFLIRSINLSHPQNKYFDEVYHAFTAGLVLNGDPKAWEWWNPHPEGFAYEWTHPPVAKLGMSLGMFIFGENSFGWRIVQVFLGSLSVGVLFLIARRVFNDNKLAVFASLALMFDGLFFVMNRIGMNDTYMLFFGLLSLLFILNNKVFLSSLSFGLAISSKWSAIYMLPILALAILVFKRKISYSYVYFLFVPIIVYISSYFVMFQTGHTWSQFVEVQRQMWWYHTNLVAEHAYSSPAWSWPLLLRPIYLYDGGVENGLVSRIYALGNPVFFWFGIASVITASILVIKEKYRHLSFIIFAYLVFFIPWIASPRIMFFYHYLPALPFLAIITAFILRKYEKIAVIYFTLLILVFAYFYPHLTGMPVPAWLNESYYWFSSWR